MTSRRELYALGEPFGDSATREKPFGRIYGGGGGGGGTSTSATQATIPDELKPAATALSNVATQVGNTPYQAYTGQGVADLNGYQNVALNQIAGQSQNNAIQQQSESALSSMLGDQTNPYLDGLVQKAQDSVKSNFNTNQVNSGSFGNSGVQQTLAQGLGDVATQMYGNAYNTNQANKLQALGLQSGVQNSAYTNANQLLNAGNTVQNNTQDQLDFNYQQYLNQQDYPLKQMQALTGVLGQNMGSTTTTTQSGGGK